jgi:cation diffusion facilitator CzcD-associated flavoprotein CzcO
MTEHSSTICVIGAGPAGLTVAKNLLARGLSVQVFEREGDLGGNWNYGQQSSSVCASTHFISSKRLTEYTDFPMPKDWPPYPSHRQALEYLRSYADHFGLCEHIQFNTAVQRVEPTGDGAWQVTLQGEAAPRTFAGLVVANGHHWDPIAHNYPGDFAGEILHARDYKTPDVLHGKRVLVVGAGNSGCDIAVEAAQHADATYLSMRRGYHFLPKFLHGRPIDICGENMHRWRWPLWLQRAASSVMVKIALGRPQRYGLPAPDHRLFESHPIVNSQLLYYVGHGRIQVLPAIERFAGDRVRFVDGREVPIDLIVMAIGYNVSFPFLERELILDEQGRPKLYLNAFHPQYDNFFVAGLLQPNSGLWGLVDYQAQLMAAFLLAQQTDPAKADWFRGLKRTERPDLKHGMRFIDSPRHVLEVEYFSYRERLKKLIKRFGKVASLPLPSRA